MNIHVRACDITEANKAGRCVCPIVLAVKREHKRGVSCMASDWIWVDGNRTEPRFDAELPKSAQKFMRAFDAGKSVSPFTFSL